MKTSQLVSSIVLLIGSTMISDVYAEVFKCTSIDKKSGQATVVYTDVVCDESAKKTLIGIQANSNLTNISSLSNPQQSDVDLLVSRAVLKRDFKLAKSLATTKEHWRLISMAEGQQAAPVSSTAVPVVIAKDTSREDCASARNDFESTSRTKWRDKDLIATKKSIMFAACGVSEPMQQNRAIVVGHSYGRVQSSRWVATPYGPVVYHKPHHKQYKNYHSNHVKSGGGLSLNYKSKHFGLSAQSFGTQKHTDIRQQFR